MSPPVIAPPPHTARSPGLGAPCRATRRFTAHPDQTRKGIPTVTTPAGAGTLDSGDAVRFTASRGQRISVSAPAEILVWKKHADLAI